MEEPVKRELPLVGEEKQSSEAAAAWRLLDAVWDVPVGLGLCDRQSRFVRVNATLASFDGLAVIDHYDDDALLRIPAQFRAGLRRAAQGDARDIEFASAGRSVLVKLHTVLRPSDREPIGVGIVALDVTDQRKALQDVIEANQLVSSLCADARAKELALTRLLESVQDGVLLVDPEGRIKQVNAAAERIIGRPRQALVGALFADERWSADDGSGNRDSAALVRQAVEHADLFAGELQLETDRGRLSVLAEATSLRDARGAVEDVVISLRDVTRERHDLGVARSNLEFQQQIIGIVGHDLRNPLATVLGSIALLRRQMGLTPSSIVSLDRAERSATRMARLISDLLDYARTRAPGGLPVVLARADLHAVCAQSIEECRSAHPSATIRFAASGDGGGCYDADRVEQALTNLLVNAIQHGGDTPIDVQSDGSAADFVEIKVHNGGAVIPADVLPQLFRAYRRGIRGEPAAPQAGLGLGLFIVDQIAAAHGGRVFAESSQAAGTTFTLQLPREFSGNGP
jgi:PAS domain S-box-containing protein